MLPRLEVVRRLRPVDLLAPGPAVVLDTPGTDSSTALPRPAPYAAAVADLGLAGRTEVTLASGTTRITGSWHTGRVLLEVTGPDGETTSHRSRRHGRTGGSPSGLATTLTGTHATVWTRAGGTWTARARAELHEVVDTRDEEWLADLRVEHQGEVERLRAGGFGALGLRDLRFVTHADGTPVRDGRHLWLTATSAGPGFFDTAHTSVWRLDPAGPEGAELTQTADLFFRRPDRPGSFGDHAIHLVRDGEGWLVATSTWGDFAEHDPDHHVGVGLARSDADLLHGEHLLDTRALPLPTDGLTSVGVWDPHLVRTGDGWLVGFVSARRYFAFHPCLATGPSLDELTLRAADGRRTATEGVTLLDLDGWHLLASDGPDSHRAQRHRMPVLDLDLHEVGVVDAPYPTNLPWPTLARTDDGWLMVTFDGTDAGSRLLGYGTHGDVVVLGEATPD